MMFLGLEWYWLILIAALLVISVPLKLKYLKWWSRREKDKKNRQQGKWGNDE